MTRTARILALVLLAFAALTATAHADEWVTFDPSIPADVQAEIRDDFNRAAEYWGRAPERGPVSVAYRQDRVGPNHGAVTETYEGKPWGQLMYVGDWYVRAASRFERCRDAVHEWGHLLGFLHRPSGDPDDVMPYLYADGTVADDRNMTGPVHINPARTCSTPEAGACASQMLATAYAAAHSLVAPEAGADCSAPAPGSLAPLTPTTIASPPSAPAQESDVRAIEAANAKAYAAYIVTLDRWQDRRDARENCMARAWDRPTRKQRTRARARCRSHWPKRPEPRAPQSVR